MIFSYFEHYFIFFNVNEHPAVLFVELARVVPVWAISVSFVYTGLLVWALIQPHKLNLTYYFKSSLLLVFCSMHICTVDQSQMYPSSISPLGLFQGIICNIHSVNPLLKFSKNEEVTLPHGFTFLFIRHFIGAILSEKSCQKWGV